VAYSNLIGENRIKQSVAPQFRCSPSLGAWALGRLGGMSYAVGDASGFHNHSRNEPIAAGSLFINMSITVMIGPGIASLLTLLVVAVLYALFFRIPANNGVKIQDA
jgi:hypothetical protein